MELSRRLQAVADMVTIGNRVADIGCDHGYVSIYLMEQKISPMVIAMDVNEGPLAKAKEHIESYGYSDYIETRLSDGAAKLLKGEAQTLLLAGMGGKLMLRIIEKEFLLIQEMKECILQPQSEISLVRKTLYQWGFLITEENMIYEEGKYYPMMKVVPLPKDNGPKRELKPEEEKYGPLLLKNKNAVLQDFLKKEQHKLVELKEIVLQEKELSPKRQKRLEELQLEETLLEKAFFYYS